MAEDNALCHDVGKALGQLVRVGGEATAPMAQRTVHRHRRGHFGLLVVVSLDLMLMKEITHL